jgi:glycosyltransferase involved in cell wall biosynthesis
MKLLVIRGDLQSHSGYSAAARAYCAELAHFFDRLIGVDIHYSPLRPPERFPYPLASEQQARRLASEADFALVLSFTTPDRYARYGQAVNIGLTFWETDRLPLVCAERPHWAGYANQMGALWAPSTHTKTMFEAAGVTVPIRVIPWPIAAPPSAPEGLPEGEVYELDRRPWFARGLASMARFCEERFGWSRWLTQHAAPAAGKRLLAGLRISSRRIPSPQQNALLCVAQDVPRKGLALLLSEWMEFKRQADAERWLLILKSSPVDPAKPRAEFVLRFWEQAQALKRQLLVRQAGVYLWTGDLSGDNFHQLLANTFGQVSSSLGEGFCGPAALALAARKPLVAPRHTAFSDYLVEDHPYSFVSRPVALGFAHDPLGVYHPASTWNLPEPYAVAGALTRLALDTPERRKEACDRAYAHLQAWCSPGKVQRLLAQELQRLMRQPARLTAA